jgi:DNA-binding NtrC family response regulator
MQTRVLMVEDDRALRAIVVGLLRERGYEVLEAGRLSDARKILASASVDVLIVDGLLPDGTGVALIEELRARNSTARVIFISAFFKDLRSHADLYQRLKVTQVLQKPTSAEYLLGAATQAAKDLTNDPARMLREATPAR